MVDLNGHEAGNGGHSQGKPIACRDSSTRRDAGFRQQASHDASLGRVANGLVIRRWCMPSKSKSVRQLLSAIEKLSDRPVLRVHIPAVTPAVLRHGFVSLAKTFARFWARCNLAFFKPNHALLNGPSTSLEYGKHVPRFTNAFCGLHAPRPLLSLKGSHALDSNARPVWNGGA